MEKLEKVIVENGITYVLGEDDIYYPDLQLPEGTNYNIGKFGHMRCEYLKEFRHGYYMELLLEGKLNEYLHDIDEECHEMRIYPHIAYYYGSERYSNGTVIKEGFYVCTDTENGRTIVPLEKWLKK